MTSEKAKTNDSENANAITPHARQCTDEREALLLANYSLRYLSNQLNCIICALRLIKHDMARNDDTAYHSYALEPVVQWLEELANDECKPCEVSR